MTRSYRLAVAAALILGLTSCGEAGGIPSSQGATQKADTGEQPSTANKTPSASALSEAQSPGPAPAGISSTPMETTFKVVENGINGLGTEWLITADQLLITTSADSSGADTVVSVTYSARAKATLKWAKNQYSLDTVLNATPYWGKDSPVCTSAMTPGKGSLSALGVTSAKTPEQWTDYSHLPYCGLNWNGIDITGPNKELRTGASAEMNGSRTVEYLVAGTSAEAVVQSFAEPEGWMFNYGNSKGICGATAFGRGPIIHATSPVC